MYKKSQHIHFVGIGGVGMSGIAEVLLNLGYKVSGSDLSESETTLRLASLGAAVNYGHRAENIGPARVVVISSAVKSDNPEVVAARATGVPVIPRAMMLAELMRLKWGIAIAGTHGKTTTTTLVSHILAHAGLDPTAVIGGRVNAFGSNAKLGQGRFLVAEADESDGSFKHLNPVIAVVTNIDPEHMDYYGSVVKLLEAFENFIDSVPFYGLAVLCMDSQNVRNIMGRVEKRVVTYGTSKQADYRAEDIVIEGLRSKFMVVRDGEELGEVTVPAPGIHNALNALAAVVVALEIEIPFEAIREGLAMYQGIGRRFQIKYMTEKLLVIDDYGHHPTEVKATLAAARAAYPDRRLIAAFQPHRFSRTRDLHREFKDAFDDADVLALTDVYAASEEPIPGINGELIYNDVKEAGHRDVHYIKDKNEISAFLQKNIQDGDVVITLGAGDIYKIGEKFIEAIKK